MVYEGKLLLRCGRCKRIIKNKPSGWIGKVPYGGRCYALVVRGCAREEKEKLKEKKENSSVKSVVDDKCKGV